MSYIFGELSNEPGIHPPTVQTLVMVNDRVRANGDRADECTATALLQVRAWRSSRTLKASR